MPGNSAAPRLVLQQRDLHLLRELHSMRVVDREQACIVASFTSVTRANTRLLALVRARYLRHVAVGTVRGGHKYLYVLTRQGAAALRLPFVSVPLKAHALVAGQPFLEHQLRLNAVYLRVRYLPIPLANVSLTRWRTFRRPLTPHVRLIPDAYIELETAAGVRAMFLEIDQGTESLRVWRRKADEYIKFALSGMFPSLFRQAQFRVLVIAPTARRVATLRACIATKTTKIFWLTTSQSVESADFWSAVWCRPLDDQPRPLI